MVRAMPKCTEEKAAMALKSNGSGGASPASLATFDFQKKCVERTGFLPVVGSANDLVCDNFCTPWPGEDNVMWISRSRKHCV